MANTPQAKKRARQAENRRQRNFGFRSKARTHIKRVAQAIAEQDRAAAQEAYTKAVKVIDQVVNKGVLHKNTAARQKRRLNARIKALSAAAPPTTATGISES